MFNKINVFFLISVSFFLLSCKTATLPKIKNPIYQTYNNSGEKGYMVTFETNKDTALPVALIINRIKQSITSDAKTGNQYKVNVIAETRKIFDYKVETTDKEDGIYFKNDTLEIFKPITFKLISK